MNKPSGFNAWKDILDVLIVPIVAVLLAFCLPHYIESVKKAEQREVFNSLIKRELHEIEPQPLTKVDGGKWYEHLKKDDFVHQRILADANTNRDFLLSMDSNSLYYLNQFWAHTKRAKEGKEDGVFLAKRWHHYYEVLCKMQNKDDPCNKTLKQWESLFTSYDINFK